MSKRILSLLLCFVMVLSTIMVVPVTAITYLQTKLTVVPDRTTANPGDIINYTIILGPVSDMGSMQMILDIPEGFTYVPNSGALADNLLETMGYDVIDWTEISLMVNGFASAADYECSGNTTIATFQCKVNDDFWGTAEVGLTYLEFYSCQTFDDHTDRFSVATIPVTVAAPAGVYEDATEVFLAGAKLNAEAPYAMISSGNDPYVTASATSAPPKDMTLFATFDAETATLTMNYGYSLKKINATDAEECLNWHSGPVMAKDEKGDTRGIYANGNLTIDLNGYNFSLFVNWNAGVYDTNVIGIEAVGDLTIKGDGHIKISAMTPFDQNKDRVEAYHGYGLKAAGDINLLGGMVYTYDRCYNEPTASDPEDTTFIYADGDIILDGGEVRMRAVKRATWVTKFNKEPIYDAANYTVNPDSLLEVEGSSNQSLGTTRWSPQPDYNNTNNVSYILIKPVLTFDVDGGDPIDAVAVREGTIVNLADYVPTKSGYIFRGWYSDSALTTPIDEIEVNADTTVYAKFELPTEYFTLTFNTNEGSAIDPVELLEGTTINLSSYVPTKAECSFKGWYSNEECTIPVASIVLLSDVTVYAKWETNYGKFERVDEAPAPVPGTEPATVVWYTDVKLTNDTPYLYGTTAVDKPLEIMGSASDEAPEGYSLLASFKDGVLTYHRGFSPSLGWNTYAQLKAVPELSTDTLYGIHANGDLVIELGMFNHFFWTNHIVGLKDYEDYAIETVHVEGNLTINGSGILKLSTNPALKGVGKQSYGLWASGNVYINEATVKMFSAMQDPGIKNNYLTFIKAPTTVLDYGSIEIYGRHQDTSPGILKQETFFKVIQEGFIWDEIEKINLGDGPEGNEGSLGNDLQTVTLEGWTNKNNLRLTSPIRPQVLFGTAMLNSDYPYAIPNTANASVSTYLASADPEGSVAEYDAVNNVLTITKSITIDAQKSIYKLEADLEPSEIPTWDIFPYKAIEAKHDLNIVIPKYVDVILTSRPFGDNSVSRPIYSPKNITISGGGTLQIYSNQAWGVMTNPMIPDDPTTDLDETTLRDWHYSSSPIWAHGKLTIGGVTAYLITNLDEERGKAGHSMYGGQGIEFKDYATIYASTKLGKLLNIKPEFYDGATVLVAAEGVSGTGLPGASSPIIPYDPEDILNMKYIQISPTPLAIENISNLDENGQIKVTDPKITFNFNVLLDTNITSENVFVNGAAVAQENITVSGKTLTIDLVSVTPNSDYKVKFERIKNEAGILYSEEVELKASSGIDIGDISLNGDVNGTVAVGENAVAVQVDKAAVTSSTEVLVIATVYDLVEIDGEQVKVRRDVASKKQSITESTVVLVDGLTAQAGDIIEVFIWNNQNDIRPVKKTVVFGN